MWFSLSRGATRSRSSSQSRIRQLRHIQMIERSSAPADHRRLCVMLKKHVCDSLTLLHDGIDILYLPDLSHACNPFHSSSPLPLALVAVINISQVYESYLAFVPVEKQTARILSRGAICMPLFSGVCRASRANASRCPLSFLSTLSTNGAETFEGHNEIRSISSCPCGASKAQESAINIFERGQCPIISFHSAGYIITVISPPDLCCWEGITT